MRKRHFEAIVLLILSFVVVALLMVTTTLATQEPETVTKTKVVTVPKVIVKTITETADAETTTITDMGEYTITAYCSCKKCVGEWYTDGPTIGSGGVELLAGVHCASPLPNGTKVIIEGIGLREVQDKTADWIAEKYKDKVIDLYFENHEDALNFGKIKANVKVIK